MRSQFIRQMAVLLAVILSIGLCFIDAGAQTRKKRRIRRAPRPVITNPAITPPTADQTTTNTGERIISTADETPDTNPSETTQADQNKVKTSKSSAKSEEDMQQTINQLSNQVNKLTDKLSQMQENERALLDMERLSRAEQRAESLRTQQVETETKLADLQSRLEQTEYWLRPENIERAQATFGSTRPEEARDARRRQLEGEKSRLQAQIKILETSRVRLEAAVATADAEVDLLRRRLDEQRAKDETSASSAPSELEPRSSNPRKKPE